MSILESNLHDFSGSNKAPRAHKQCHGSWINGAQSGLGESCGEVWGWSSASDKKWFKASWNEKERRKRPLTYRYTLQAKRELRYCNVETFTHMCLQFLSSVSEFDACWFTSSLFLTLFVWFTLFVFAFYFAAPIRGSYPHDAVRHYPWPFAKLLW